MKRKQPLRPLWDRAVERGYQRRGKGGEVGRVNPDGTMTIDVEERPGQIYVTPDDGGPVVECFNGGITPSPRLPVQIVRTHDGYLEAIANGIRTNTHLGQMAGSTGLTIPHTHQKGGGLDDYVDPNRFTPGLIHATNPPSMSVIIEGFWYEGVWIATTTFDITSAQPGTSGAWAWVAVAYDPAAQDFVAITGDENPVVVPLNEELLADFDMTGYVPLDAVRVRADDTSIPEVDNNGVARYSIGGMRHFLGRADVSSLKYSAANVSNPPTDAELDTAFGTPAEVGAGFTAALNDNGAGTNFWLISSDGTNWWYVAGTKAV